MDKTLFFEYFENRSVALRNKLVEQNVNLAYKIAHEVYRQTFYNFEELKQEALLALIKVVEAYNPHVGAFSTYAVLRIKGRLYNFLRDKSNLIRIPRRAIEMQRKWLKTRNSLERKLKRLPNNEEVATASGVTLQEYLRAQRTIDQCRGVGELNPLFIDSPCSNLSGLMKTILANYSQLTILQKQVVSLFMKNKTINQISKTLKKPHAEVRTLLIETINSVQLTIIE